ncbi:MAG: hypothetical protein R3B13_04085 [Polyangiaceae bacterium]
MRGNGPTIRSRSFSEINVLAERIHMELDPNHGITIQELASKLDMKVYDLSRPLQRLVDAKRVSKRVENHMTVYLRVELPHIEIKT